VIDTVTYKRQLDLLRAHGHQLFERLTDAERVIDEEAYLVTAHVVLELAKSARSIWEARSDQQKCDFLAKLVCNPTLDGRTVRYDLRKPFEVLAKMRREERWRARLDSNQLPPA
jgi:hypothetical protein